MQTIERNSKFFPELPPETSRLILEHLSHLQRMRICRVSTMGCFLITSFYTSCNIPEAKNFFNQKKVVKFIELLEKQQIINSNLLSPKKIKTIELEDKNIQIINYTDLEIILSDKTSSVMEFLETSAVKMQGLQDFIKRNYFFSILSNNKMLGGNPSTVGEYVTIHKKNPNIFVFEEQENVIKIATLAYTVSYSKLLRVHEYTIGSNKSLLFSFPLS